MAKDDADKPLSTKPAAHHWWHKFLGFENNAAEKRRDDDQENSREIIELELPAGEGVLEQDEREMIHGVVEMGETAVKEIMVPRVEIVGIEIGTPSSEIIDKFCFWQSIR